MKIDTTELTGAALDWAVAKCEGDEFVAEPGVNGIGMEYEATRYSTDWAQAGPIIEREGISVIRCEDESMPDAEGFWCGKYEPRWAAVIGDRHRPSETYGPQGDHWGDNYEVDGDAVIGPTSLIAAMRCYVASKLGDEVGIPDELIGGPA